MGSMLFNRELHGVVIRVSAVCLLPGITPSLAWVLVIVRGLRGQVETTRGNASRVSQALLYAGGSRWVERIRCNQVRAMCAHVSDSDNRLTGQFALESEVVVCCVRRGEILGDNTQIEAKWLKLREVNVCSSGSRRNVRKLVTDGESSRNVLHRIWERGR